MTLGAILRADRPCWICDEENGPAMKRQSKGCRQSSKYLKFNELRQLAVEAQLAGLLRVGLCWIWPGERGIWRRTASARALDVARDRRWIGGTVRRAQADFQTAGKWQPTNDLRKIPVQAHVIDKLNRS